MKYIISILALLILIYTPGTADNLKRLNLDDAATIGMKIRTDSKIKVEGKGSVRISTRWPTSVCLGEVTSLEVENAKLVYEARVRSDLEGGGAAFLEMWVHIGGGWYFSKGMNDPIKGKSGWKSIRTPFLFQKGQKPERVILNIVINGKGTVWIDDIVLSREALK